MNGVEAKAAVSITEINQMVDELFEWETKCSSLRNQAKAADEFAEQIRRKLMGILGEAGLKSFRANAGTVTVAHRFQVRFPKDPETKEALREYLATKEAFDSLWSINHQTLNAFYKAEKDIAESQGVYLDIPGLEPTVDEYLQFRKGGN